MKASCGSFPPLLLSAALAYCVIVTFGYRGLLVCGFSSSPISYSPTRMSSSHMISLQHREKLFSFNRIPKSSAESSLQRHVMTTTTTTTRRASSPDDDISVNDDPIQEKEEVKIITNKLDTVLSQLTSAFPVFVLGSAILGFVAPSTLQWVSRGNLISLMLASVMMGTGMTLEKKDFTQVLVDNFASVPAGVLCQFMIMPTTAFVVGRTLLLKQDAVLGPTLFLGLALVGCSPGGTASNLVSLIAKADVALSVLLTSCSTMLASIMTPLLVKLLVGSTVQVSGMTLCLATAKVVLLPVILGMILNAKAPSFSKNASRFTPFASVLLVALICGGVVSNNASAPLGSSSTASSTSLLPWIVAAVLALHSIGFLAGYLVPRLGLGYSEKTARTISIETGMQNSALAVVLAQSIGANPLAGLPGALSATAHSCLGSILAAYWRFVDSSRRNNKNDNKVNDKKGGEKNETDEKE